MSSDFEAFIGGLRPDVVIEDVGPTGRALSISEALAIRSWFEQRRKKLVSSGGRPTNPDWSMKRQIPLAKETWESLKRLAHELSEAGPAVSPAQLASLLLEDAVAGGRGHLVPPVVTGTGATQAEVESLDEAALPERYRSWRMPPVFGLAA